MGHLETPSQIFATLKVLQHYTNESGILQEIVEILQFERIFMRTHTTRRKMAATSSLR